MSMLSAESHEFLRALLDAPGPSGFETRPAAIWRAEAAKFAAISRDVAGNSIAVVNPDASPTIMLAGHIDEIGVIVTHIDEDGFVYVGPLAVGIRRYLSRNASAFPDAPAMCTEWSASCRFI